MVVSDYKKIICRRFRYQRCRGCFKVLKYYIDEHSKKFESFTVSVFWKTSVNDKELYINLTIPNQISSFESVHGVFMKITEIPWRFLYCFSNQRPQNIIFNKNLEMKIVFTSDRDFMTYQHYLEQPKSMLERKIFKKVYNNPKINGQYSWLPLCLTKNVYWLDDSDDEEEG